MKLTYKCRLRPTKAQQHILAETLEVCRSVYNSTLAVRKNGYEQRGERLNYYATAKLLPIWKSNATDSTKVHSQVLQNVQMRVDVAFQAFFRRVKAGEEPGYPRFKGRGQYQSLTYPQYSNGVKRSGDLLTLSKGGAVRIQLHRPIEGEIKTVTLQRDGTGTWYAYFSCEVEAQPLAPTEQVVGIDLGLKTFVVFSDGGHIQRQYWMKRDADDIACLQRKKERFAKGSIERKQVLLALNHAYQRASNRRTDFAHQQSRKLVNAYQVIAFEKLDIQAMQSLGNTSINRSLADVAWGQFVHYCAYKAESASRTMVRVNPRGTTQECSVCGEVVPNDLSVRVHDCPHCGLKLDRDLNAANNILAGGLAILRSGGRSSRL